VKHQHQQHITRVLAAWCGIIVVAHGVLVWVGMGGGAIPPAHSHGPGQLQGPCCCPGVVVVGEEIMMGGGEVSGKGVVMGEYEWHQWHQCWGWPEGHRTVVQQGQWCMFA
jgi:hypothetical protein